MRGYFCIPIENQMNGPALSVLHTLLLSRQSPFAVKEPVPQFCEETHSLVALSELFRQHAHFGIVLNEKRTVGVVRRGILSEQILMNQTVPVMPKTGWEL